MSFDPSILTVTELVTGLRAGAAGQYPKEAAVELLIRHWNWLARPAFTQHCVHSDDGTPRALTVSWWRLVEHAHADEIQPNDRAIALIAAQLGGFLDPLHVTIDMDEIPPLAWLLANLKRPEVELTLAAISHAAGAHDHVLHVGEPVSDGQTEQWRVTATSPRLRPGPLHPWPAPAVPGLTEETSTTERW
jgi:hypothetical protein